MTFLALQQHAGGGEAALVLPNLNQALFLGGIGGRALLLWGLVICALGLLFGLATYTQLKNLPVHRAMREISELIYETCKTYLLTQGRFLLILWLFIGAIVAVYFGTLAQTTDAAGNMVRGFPAMKVIIILLFSFELLLMLLILLFIPGDYAGPCFIGFAIGESLGAAALRVAGGIFTKIADIGADLMKIVFKIKEDDARNPGVIADCTGDNAGDSVGPSADGFETYGVTGVALITFILLAVKNPTVQVQLLVWIFVMRVLMIVASGVSYLLNEGFARAKYGSATRMNFEAPLTSLVWLTSIVSVLLTSFASWELIRDLGDGTLWWKLSTVITCGTLAGAIIPELVKIFTSTESGHVREVAT